MVTTGSFPAGVAVAGTGHVITGGVVETIAHLATAIPIGTWRAFLFAVESHEASATGAQARDVVAVGSVTTLADL